jgi:hypothetical protein
MNWFGRGSGSWRVSRCCFRGTRWARRVFEVVVVVGSFGRSDYLEEVVNVTIRYYDISLDNCSKFFLEVLSLSECMSDRPR